MTLNRWIVLVAAAWMLLLPASAWGYGGYVSGRFTFYQNQGGYCPTTRDCTGSHYLQSEYNTYEGIAHTVVYLADWDHNNPKTILGQATTDANGNFTISWYSQYPSTNAYLYWNFRQQDGRFQLFTPSGGTYESSTGSIALVNSTTASAPQGIGTYGWGSATAPHDLSNTYDGAQRMWYNSLAYSNRMVNGFSGVSIYAYSNTQPNSCATSCASGANIQLDTGAAYVPQSRVMHEMGHIARYVSNGGWKSVSNYCYPSSSCTSGGWSLAAPAWTVDQFEEGVATFFGDVAFYWGNAVAPHDCFSTSACANGVFNLETSSGGTYSGTSCVTNEFRWPVTAMRALWDMYDTPPDIYSGTVYPGSGPNLYDNVNTPYAWFFDTVAVYPQGENYADNNAPWCNFFLASVCNLDSRGIGEFIYNHDNRSYPGTVSLTNTGLGNCACGTY